MGLIALADTYGLSPNFVRFLGARLEEILTKTRFCKCGVGTACHRRDASVCHSTLCKLLKDSRLPNPDDQFQGHVPRCFQGRSGRGLAPLNLATRYSSPPLLPRSAGTPKDRAPGSPEQHGSNCSRRESTARLMGFAVGMVKLDERSEHGPAKHGVILGAGSLN